MFRTHPLSKMAVFWGFREIFMLSTPSVNHVNLFVNVSLRPVNNTNPWKLQLIRSSFQDLEYMKVFKYVKKF